MKLRHVLCLSLLTAFSASTFAAAPRALPARPAVTYPIVVSFISIGTGVSSAAIAHFNVLLAEFEQNWGVPTTHVIAHWGREGEFDACFTLAGMPPAARDELVDQLWQMEADPLINVAEQATCGH